MKKLNLAVLFVIVCTSHIYSRNNTSFKLGMPFSTAQVLLGAKNVQGKNLTPTIGISYFGMSSKYKYNDNGDSGESDMAAKFFIPRVGARLLGNRVGDLNSYYFGEVFMVIPIFSGSDLSTDDKKTLKDETDVLGVTIGSGVEYFFSDSLSIGGEFSLNILFHSFTDKYSDSYESYKDEYSTRLEATLTQVTFNYYFK